MGKLQVLPSGIANMIAAGEVVQRPASVIKELMENAIDAGADNISVICTDSGRTLMQVIDNGCGMNGEDALLCFERHATSKLSRASDLQNILTYGFRGEALPSIASISEVKLKTRRKDSETGTCVEISGGSDTKVKECTCPPGSSFEIRNIFYNTPARRKFLKSDNIELKHIIDEFTRIAVPHPEVALSLRSNNRDIYSLKKAKSLKFRIMDLFGSSVSADLLDINADSSVVKISGFVGTPKSARKTSGNQYFFAGGRYFRSPYLHKAVMNAYQEMIPEGTAPSYFIFLDVAADSIDVNIHPTKAEVKFENESVIFQMLYACVKETLGRSSFNATIDFDTEGAVIPSTPGRSFEEFSPIKMPGYGGCEDYNPFDIFKKEEGDNGRNTPEHRVNAAYHPAAGDNYGALFENRQITSPLSVKGRFIISPSASGILIVNVSRARERIFYERAMAALSKYTPAGKSALFPVQVQVGPRGLAILEGETETLEKVGYEIAPFGSDTAVVSAVPEGFSLGEEEVRRDLLEIIDILENKEKNLDELVNQNLAVKMAAVSARNSGGELSASGARAVLDSLFECDNSETSPRGHRICKVLSSDELDKMF